MVPEALDCLGGQLVAVGLLLEVVEEAVLVARENVAVGLGAQLGPHAVELAVQEGGDGRVEAGLVLAGDVQGLL